MFKYLKIDTSAELEDLTLTAEDEERILALCNPVNIAKALGEYKEKLSVFVRRVAEYDSQAIGFEEIISNHHIDKPVLEKAARLFHDVVIASIRPLLTKKNLDEITIEDLMGKNLLDILLKSKHIPEILNQVFPPEFQNQETYQAFSTWTIHHVIMQDARDLTDDGTFLDECYLEQNRFLAEHHIQPSVETENTDKMAVQQIIIQLYLKDREGLENFGALIKIFTEVLNQKIFSSV